MSSAICFILDQSKILSSGKELSLTKMIITIFDRVENIVGKGEIACTSIFSFFPQCFQKASFPDPSKGVIMWQWLNNEYMSHLKISFS